MKPGRRLWVYNLLLTLCFASTAPAQEQPTFRDAVEVRVINVDVFVEDRDGNRVYGLTPDDFILLENGKVQPITNFSEYRSGRNSDLAPVSGDLRVGATPEDVVTSAAERQPRTVIFFVDAFHQKPQDREQLFGQIRAFLRESLGPGDRAALLTWRRATQEVVPLTTDLRRIDDGLSALGGLQLPEADPGLDALRTFFEESAEFAAGAGATGPSVAEQMEFVIRNCAEDYLNEMEAKTTSLQRVVNSLAGVEGRKALVYVAGRFPANTLTFCSSTQRSPGFGAPGGNFSTDKLVEQVTRAANAAGVTFYPIRPTLERRTTNVESAYAADEFGTPNSSELGDQVAALTDADALATLAERTGGRLAIGDWMIDDLIPEIVADLDDYYSLGYRASSDGTDRTRNIKVRMKDRGYRVRTRDAFVEKSRLTEVKDQLVANLLGKPVSGDIQLETIELEPRQGRRGRTILPVEVRIPLDQLIYSGAKPATQIRLLSAAGDAPGSISKITEVVKKIEQPPANLPGAYITWEVEVSMNEDGGKAAFGVFDESSGLAGFTTVDRTTETLERREKERLQNLGQWQLELIRRSRSGKPVLAYFRPEVCVERNGFEMIAVCENFERNVLGHESIEPRLAEVELVRWEPDGAAADWPEDRPGLALVRVDGTRIVSWPALPDLQGFRRAIDVLTPQAAELNRISQLVRHGQIEEADLSTAMLQIRFGLRDEAAEVLSRVAEQSTTPILGEMAAVRLAFLESNEDRRSGVRKLRALARDATEPVARAEAWLAVAALVEGDDKVEALNAALAEAPAGTQQRAIAENELNRLGS